MKKKIAEQVLNFLAEQRLDPTPGNYTLGYMLFERGNAELVKAVNTIIDDGVRITQKEVDKILNDFGVANKSGGDDAFAPGEDALHQQLVRFGDIASNTRSATSAFGRDLGEQLKAISGNPEIAALVSAMLLRTQRTETDLAASMDEIGRLRQDLESARNDANRDKLTGLANRRALDERLADIERRGAKCTIAICDIDHFKKINDTYGHGVGDRVIKVVGQTIKDHAKEHMVGRWGGEEFMVIMEGVGVPDASKIVDGARKYLNNRGFRVRDTDQPIGQVTFSAGVAMESETAQATLVADERLYLAKQLGRNQVISSGRSATANSKAA